MLGHFRGENGKRPELNHVSKTSWSWSAWTSSIGIPNFLLPFYKASYWLRAAIQLASTNESGTSVPFLYIKYAGIRWPHHNCLEMHQSFKLPIHLSHVFYSSFGWIISYFFSTTSSIRFEIYPHLIYHWGLIIGSIISFDLEQRPNLIVWSFLSFKSSLFFNYSSIILLH